MKRISVSMENLYLKMRNSATDEISVNLLFSLRLLSTFLMDTKSFNFLRRVQQLFLVL